MYKYVLAGVLLLVSSCVKPPVEKSFRTMQDDNYEIFFATSSDALDASSQQTLRAVAHVVSRTHPKKILINGNADRSGTLQHNKELSMKRAEAVANFLEHRGVNREIMDVRAYGASAAWNEKSPEDSDDNYRSVKVILLKYNKIEYR